MKAEVDVRSTSWAPVPNTKQQLRSLWTLSNTSITRKEEAEAVPCILIVTESVLTNYQRGHYKIHTPKDQNMFVIALMDLRTTAILVPLCFLFATIITPIASDQT